MHVLRKGEIQILMDEEIDWARAHSTVPQADALLKLLSFRRGRGFDRDLEKAIMHATFALRKVHPRPLAVCRELYAYVVKNPNVPGEGIPSYIEDNMLKAMVGFDLQNMRTVRRVYDEMRLDDRRLRKATLWRFDFDRIIGDGELLLLESLNAKVMECREIFAFTGPQPSGDEVVLGLMHKGVGKPLLEGSVHEIKQYLPVIQEGRRRGQKVVLKRFVRAEKVNDDSF
jgi:hypothetical protein